jgi:hypothetical protein
VINGPKGSILERIRGCAELSDADKAAAIRDYPDHLPGQFRLLMTVGQNFEKQGPLRTKFYDSVLSEADEARSLIYCNYFTYCRNSCMRVLICHRLPHTRKRLQANLRNGAEPTRRVFCISSILLACLDQRLIEVVDLQAVIQRVLKKVFSLSTSQSRVLVLAFDEAHTLFSTNATGEWTAFASLRRALRGMRHEPIWSVFLSTTGKSTQFVPPPYLDKSDRVLWGLLHNAVPFTLLGFDTVATKFQDDMTLEDVTLPSFRYSLGRPLYVLFRHFCLCSALPNCRWLTRYENGCQRVRDTMIDFAIQKLLCCLWPNNSLDTGRQFAVMSRRLALDFDTTVCDGKEREEAERNQMVQVERHMRVCLAVKEGLDSAVTVAASEPILSEAAATVMQHPSFRSSRALRNILQWPGMSKGDRGELITQNITIDTLDSVMFENHQLKSLSVEVTAYFQALFASDIYTTTIESMLPSRLGSEDRNRTFAETFANSRIYVTHFIKVYDYNVLSTEFLAKCAARGAAIVYADNQPAVDIVIPVVIDKDKPLTKENVAPLFKQSKNDLKYKAKVIPSVFHAMDPYALGTFDISTKNPPPVIRMVYALASRKSKVRIVRPPELKPPSRTAKYAYTSFDI